MSSIGEKIKGVFTGHHSEHQETSDAKTPDVTAPGAFPEDKPTHKDTELLNKLNTATGGERKQRDSGVDVGASQQQQHQHQHQHHHGHGHGHGHDDPEVATKEATSAAGNYPYWGDLSREGEQQGHQHSHQQGVIGAGSYQEPQHSSHKDHALGAGALATGAGATGAGYLASKYRDSPQRTQETSSTGQQYLPDRTRETTQPTTSSSAPIGSTMQDRKDESRKKELAAATGAGAAGAAGAGYLSSRHENPSREAAEQRTMPGVSSGPAQAGPGRLDPGYTSQASQGYTPRDTSSTGAGAGAFTSSPSDSRKKEEALAVGAGAVGLGGAAAYLGSRQHDNDNTSRSQDRPTTIGTGSSPAQRETTGGGIHNTVVGAGSAEDAQMRKFPLDSSHVTTVGPQTTTLTTTAGSMGQQQQLPTATRDLGAPQSGDHRDRQGLAAAAGVGAGAGAVAGEERHRHHRDDNLHNVGDNFSSSTSTRPQDNYSGGGGMPGAYQSSTQTPAQTAAKQAWNKQEQPAAGSGDHGDRARYETAALGTAAGAGIAGAGATAAYYGQGKEHEQSPRTNESEKIAQRAMGEDDTPQAPSYQSHSSSGLGGTGSDTGRKADTSGSSGMFGRLGQQSGSKVVHKCHQCGADNDISDYFNKDAAFKMGS